MNQLRELYNNFEKYAEYNLRIRTKRGEIKPFIFNEAQRYLDTRVNEQLERTGKVRILILKGRQQGMSTYVEGRFYWRTSLNEGRQAFILTHLDDATKTLYQMVMRFHDNGWMKPSTGTSPGRELTFDKIDSGYSLGTANNKGTGRSQMINYFHGSEVAYWANAQEHAKGVMQTVPDLPGTEVFLESTANGVGNYFHQQCMLALKGESDYELVFIPWFWQTEYRSDVPEGFTVTEEEHELVKLYNLDRQQLAWRRKKVLELSVSGEDGEHAFRQEYPCSIQEAFDTTGDEAALLDSKIVTKARKTECEKSGPLMIGVDPARFGNDRSSIIRRRGRVAYDLESHRKKDTMEIAGRVHTIIENEQPNKVFVDVTGLGAGVVDRLRELGHDKIIVPVSFGGKPLDDERYSRKDAECWGLMNLWFKDEPCDIPDKDSLHSDLCSRRYGHDSKGRLKLESKDDMKKRGLPSPDEAEALALTFAEPPNENTSNILSTMYGGGAAKTSGWLGT